MEYRHVGSSGLQLSALSFGAWVTFGQQIDEDAARACMEEAYEAGVNFFDNAEVYAAGEAEAVMGRVLRRTGWRRSSLVLSTKIFWGGDGPNERGLSRKHVVEGLEASLERLGVDRVDLVFCHRPDPRTPLEESVRAMNHVIERGKAYYWGTSEWSAAEILQAHGIARREHLIPPSMEQPQYNMLHRDRVEREYAPLYREIGLGTTTWSPLASGLLTGKYNEGQAPPGSRATLESYGWLAQRLVGDEARANVLKVRALAPIAEELGCTLAQLALAWCLINPNVSSVITGATKPEQVRENMRALEIVPKLDAVMLERIEGVLLNRPEVPRDWR
jgi:voltage-dependent potassium channel beta subunit